MNNAPVACCALLLALSLHHASHARATASGITFAIDTVRVTTDEHPDVAGTGEMAAFASFTGRVTYAAGRGRLDVTGRRVGPTVLVDGLAPTTPLAMPGDYYLFDSTGFVLVRPGAKTFSAFTISDDAYNYSGRGDGWPQFFQVNAARFDTVTQGRAVGATRRGPIHLYWHTDAARTAIARGRLTLDDAPMSEMIVAQWFGAARSFARLADSTHTFLKTGVTLTTAVPQWPSGVEPVPVSFILKQDLLRPETTDVDLSRLVLPNGFAEMPWLGQDARRSPDPARWRRMPPTN